jgi:hypothetical protein
MKYMPEIVEFIAIAVFVLRLIPELEIGLAVHEIEEIVEHG